MRRFTSICVLFVILCFSGIASAGWVLESIEGETTANISVNEEGGWVNASCSSSFAKYKYCYTGITPVTCREDQAGFIKIIRDGKYQVCISYASGCTGLINPLVLSNGTHTFQAISSDSSGKTVVDTTTITIDNTPKIQILNPSPNEIVEGEFDIAGIVEFKENPEGNEGTIFYYLDGSGSAYKHCSGTSVNFSYESDRNHRNTSILNAAYLSQGRHTVKVVGRADIGNETSQTTSTIVVDNKPTITISSPSPNEKIEEPFDFTGTVKFKDNPEGYEGSLYYYVDGTQIFAKYIEGTDFDFSYNTDKPTSKPPLDPLSQNWWTGIHTLKIRALAANGVDATQTVNIIIGCGEPTYSLDNDGDGINDCEDNCPKNYNPDQANGDIDDLGNVCDECLLTPEFCSYDEKGCPTDSDGDGNPDCYELCEENGAKTVPGPCGCDSSSEGTTDSDGDGIYDCVDDCSDKKGNASDGCKHDDLFLGLDKVILDSQSCPLVSDPVSIFSGNHIESETDLKVNSPFDGQFAFKRFYNSQSAESSPMGLGWTHNYNITMETALSAVHRKWCVEACDFDTRGQLIDHYSGWTVVHETSGSGTWGKVTLCPTATCTDIDQLATSTYCEDFTYPCGVETVDKLVIHDETGFGHHFAPIGTGNFVAMFGDKSRLALEDSLYVWYRTDGTRAAFDPGTKLLTWIEDKNGKPSGDGLHRWSPDRGGRYGQQPLHALLLYRRPDRFRQPLQGRRGSRCDGLLHP